eukprot:551253-Amorphochlora_amoeboformis.AAC.1
MQRARKSPFFVYPLKSETPGNFSVLMAQFQVRFVRCRIGATRVRSEARVSVGARCEGCVRSGV